MKNPMKYALPSIYRGSRPESAQDLKALWDAGVRTIINLEEGWANIINPFLWRKAKAEWEKMGGTYFEMGRDNFFPAGNGELEGTHLLIASAKDRGHVFIHCKFGVDRTGVQVAYEQVRVGDNPEDAWNDCLQHGFHNKAYWWWKPYFMDATRRYYDVTKISS